MGSGKGQPRRTQSDISAGKESSDVTLAVLADGTKEWRLPNGLLHRDDGPAVESPYNVKEWYKDGKRHREGGPAVEKDSGWEEWWFDGQRHREDGPAATRPGGDTEWYLHGDRK